MDADELDEAEDDDEVGSLLLLNEFTTLPK